MASVRMFMAMAATASMTLGACTPTILEKPVKVSETSLPKPIPLPLDMLPEEKQLIGGRRPDWGLALSGGGLRSALISIGVLKALYDIGRLRDIDVISTVSGGGYAAYWLYANHLASREQQFGSYSLSDGEFPKRACELMATGNFVTYSNILRRLNGNVGAREVKLYQSSLHRTFGWADPERPAFTPVDLDMEIAKGGAPYLIMNATIMDGEARTSWPHKLLELTPVFYGNSDMRSAGQVPYRTWASEPRNLPVRNIASVSGAAFKGLEQKLDIVNPGTGQRGLWANDGGQSENLGAIALIRRGIPNIIVVDAEHDPVYIFEAYSNLKANLTLYGLSLESPDIDSHLAAVNRKLYDKAVSLAFVRQTGSGKLISTIHYVKADLPRDRAALLLEQDRMGSEGQEAAERLKQAVGLTADKADGEWICQDVAVAPLPMEKWSAYWVGHYSAYLNKRNTTAKLARVVAGVTAYQAIRLDFPHYSTGVQSMKNDQVQAYLGLGYLEGLSLGPWTTGVE